MKQSLVIIHPFQLPDRWDLSRPNLVAHKQHLYSKIECTARLTRPKIKIPLDMQGLWLVGMFCQKATKIIDPYFQYFSSSSSELTIIK
jgi:hypothetical protein